MYPVTPGADTLAVHGALFPSVLIQRPGGNIQLNGGSASSQYVQGLSLNGTALSRNYLRYPDIAAGGTVTFSMGGSASSWGTGAGDVPPSFSDGAVQPTAPDLGPNLALNKPVSGSTPCGASESAAKAVDGSLTGNSKWCSGVAPRFLQVDLGSAQTVGSFVLKHAGLGGEHTGYNTAAFTIQTSTDGTNFSPAVSVSGSRSSRTYHPISPRTARYVRLDVTAPANDGDNAARIYEFEVYGAGGGGANNIALNRPATADSQCGSGEGPEKAVNGSVSGGWSDKWCSKGASRWLRVDLGSRQHIGSMVVRHAGAGAELPAWNTRDFDLQVSDDGNQWTTVAQARGNTADSTTHAMNTNGRYVRLNVITPTSNGDDAARIYDLEVYP
jgi:hypothetical protein